jgi:hypothetical protein
VLALLVVGVLVAGAVLVLGGDDGDEVVLEPIGSTLSDDFAGDLDTLNAEELGELVSTMAVEEVEDPRSEESTDVGLAGHVVEGAAPAVYGGSRNAQVCDVQALVDFLTAEENAGQAVAWAGVQGIEVSEIADYVATLTAVRLRFDTRVTNHGYTDGEANSFQSLLQAGTAVLVDELGVPRVKCNCGNPLLEPEAMGGGMDVDSVAQNPDEAWESLDPAQVVEVTPASAEVTEITIVDFEDGTLLDRPVGSDGESKQDIGTGDVQVTLEWEGDADLDLHVVDPEGSEIYYSADTSPSGGQLDVDANVGCEDDDGVPGAIENVFWPSGGAPTGGYEVWVNGFDTDCVGGSQDYTLTIQVAGEQETHTGSVGNQEDSESYTFDV